MAQSPEMVSNEPLLSIIKWGHRYCTATGEAKFYRFSQLNGQVKGQTSTGDGQERPQLL
jgi:hypothetical protein